MAHRTLPALLAVVLAASLLSAVPLQVAPVSAQVSGPDVEADEGTAGGSGTTPVLPAFQTVGSDLVRIMAGAFDPLGGAPAGAAAIPAVDAGDIATDVPVYWVVQVRDGDFAGAQQAIAEAGGIRAGFVPDAAYLVRATTPQQNVIAADPAIRAAIVYQPAWKVPVATGGRPGLLDLDGQQAYRVYAFTADPDIAGVHAAVTAVDGVEVLQVAGRVIDVAATAAQLPAIAEISGVEWIESVPEVVAMNANARWVNDTGVRDLRWATLPDRLDGSGQVAAVADTGVNYQLDDNGVAHVAFRDCDEAVTECRVADYTQANAGNSAAALHDVVANGSDHRKMVAYFDIGNSGVSPTDGSAHGTHVAGSVVGDAGELGVADGHDGMAPAARLVHQNIGSPSGGLSTPSDAYELWRQAYRPRNPASVPTAYDPDDYANYVPGEDARTHNNSYGLIVPGVSLGSAEAADRFVWEHEDMVIVSSAGNSGPRAESVGAPSLGKNVLTSGASANGRQPMVSIDSMAIFSSHGPTPDGRLGVDLATPGQIVVSPKGGTEAEYHYLQGTSMSGPLLTGQATLVRQYFFDGYGPGAGPQGATASGLGVGDADAARQHNPSAALVRATLTNGADRMRGFYTGDDGTVRAEDGQYPSAGQGFGLVNLEQSLFFDDADGRSPRTNWYHDVWRADEDAFAPTAGAATRSYQLDVAEGQPLSVTMAFTDAPGSLPAGTAVQVNNLDLVVTSPSGTVYAGNNFNTRATPTADEYETLPGPSSDVRNPVERVRIAQPEAGTWTIDVRATAVAEGPQGFALAANGLLSAPGDPAPTAGALQTDAPGAPEISDVAVEPISADILRVTWSTSEPTTGEVRTTVDGAEVSYPDVYNLGLGTDGREPGYHGITEGPVETSLDYANRAVVGTDHEVLVTGLTAGGAHALEVVATDLAEATATARVDADAPVGIYGAAPADIGQLVEDPSDPVVEFDPILGLGGAGFLTGTQLYAGSLGADAGALGAFMFRLPEDLDPDTILGAAVELTSAHSINNLYVDDARMFVDLLPDAVEPDWQTSTYTEIHNAESQARLNAETGSRRGGGQTYAFSFGCTDLSSLQESLSVAEDGERRAAFRFDALSSQATSAFAAEFGFNRRSQGADLRPRLVLYLDDGQGAATDPAGCDESTPAPTISDIGVLPGIQPGTGDPVPDETRMTVSWRTDVPSDSTVIFREVGTSAYTTVGSQALATAHNVQVSGLDPDREYEFAVRSTNCAGRATTDDNDGAAYDFFPRVDDAGPSDGPATTVAGPYGFEEDAEGWTVEVTRSDGPLLQNEWERQSPGNDSPTAFAVAPYVIDSDTTLTSPPLATGGGEIALSWFHAVDTEAGFDFLVVEQSTDEDTWEELIRYSGQNDGYPDFEQQEVRFTAPDGPLFVRFLFTSDELLASESGEEGVRVDDVLIEVRDAVAPPEEEDPEVLPAAGPIPAPSADAADFDVTPVVTGGSPTRADLDAGTATCAALPDRVVDGGPGTGTGAGIEIRRVAGDNRVETAVAVSQEAYDESAVVVLARADDYADALTGASLAAGAEAPLLLSATEELTPQSAAEITRLGASRAVLLGGVDALAPQVQSDLEDMGLEVERVGGPNRFATAALIAAELGGDTSTAFVAEGEHANPNRGFPDPLSAAPLAAFTGRPILLVNRDRLPQETADALADLSMGDTIVIGGEAAVSPQVFDAIADAGHQPRRVAGTTRYETSAAVYDLAVEAGMDPAEPWLATGEAFPDALTGGATIAALGHTLMLVQPETLDSSPPTRQTIEATLDILRIIRLLGGTLAISQTVEDELRDLVRGV